MTLQEAVKYYGSGNKLVKALGILLPNYTQWKKANHIPELQQWRIQFLTNNRLLCDFAIMYGKEDNSLLLPRKRRKRQKAVQGEMEIKQE